MPTAAVSEIRGKKAARAAPMLALAALSRCSAASTSGRWRRISEERPAEGSAGSVTPPRSSGRSAAGTGDPARRAQGVHVLGRHLGPPGNLHPGRFDLALGPLEVQLGGDPEVMLFPDQPIGGLLRLQGGRRRLEGLPVRGQEEIGLGSGGDEQDLGAAAGLIRGEVLLQCPVFEAADPAEEVDLPGGDAEIDIVPLGLVVACPDDARSAGTRDLLMLPRALTEGRSSARWMP